MVQMSVQVEAFFGATWPTWKTIVSEVDRLGYTGLFSSDHFTLPPAENHDALELIVSLAYLADHTDRVRFGSLVSPVSFRDPVMLARQAAVLSRMSGGRMILGVGSGWREQEHRAFGYDLGDRRTRMDRLEEGLEVVTLLLRSTEPVSFSGRFYRLQDAVLMPHVARSELPLMVGGTGPTRTLPMVARYADIWSAVGVTPEDLRDLNHRLDELLRERGREPGDVKRTMQAPVVCWRNAAERDRRLGSFAAIRPDIASLAPDQALDELQAMFGPLMAGTPDQVAVQIGVYAQAGLQELMAQVFVMDDVENLRLIAEEVIPRVA